MSAPRCLPKLPDRPGSFSADRMRIAVLVPEPGYPEPWRWAYDLEAAALEDAGATVEPVAWTETKKLKGFDLVLPLVAWGYHLDYTRWLVFLETAETKRLPL